MSEIDTSTEAVEAMEQKFPDMIDKEVFAFIKALAADRDEWIDVADDQMKLQKAARRTAFEEAAKYHDDRADEHDALTGKHVYHVEWARQHRRDAAALRSLAEKEPQT